MKVRLLRALIPLRRPVSGREAARLSGVSHIAKRSLDELAALGIVRRQETSGQHLYQFDTDNALSGPLQRLFGAEAERTESVFATLASFLGGEDHRDKILAAAVFGSAARGEAGPESDLDLLVVVSEDVVAGPVSSTLEIAAAELYQRFGLKLSPVILPLEAARRQRADEETLVSEVMRASRRVMGPHISELVNGQADET